eukprot:COSAG05_NODE_7679_length_780_cov_1.362702_2_plen_21_part_01
MFRTFVMYYCGIAVRLQPALA